MTWTERIADKLKKYAPPTIDLEKEVSLFRWGMILATLFSLSFLVIYVQVRAELFQWKGEDKVLIEGAKMPDFFELTEGSFIGFAILAFVLVGLVIYHYVSFYQESKSVYLMKRLPDKWEIHRRNVLLPLAGIVVMCVTILLLILVYYGIYLFFTPQQCLPG